MHGLILAVVFLGYVLMAVTRYHRPETFDDTPGRRRILTELERKDRRR